MSHLKPSTANRGFGRLENAVMEVLWTQGESTVHEVREKLDRPLAYTTVMTTLDRLYKKGVLGRRDDCRRFRYCPRLSRQEYEQKRARHLAAGFLAGGDLPGELLISGLIEAVVDSDEALLDALEKKIKLKRAELGYKRE